MVTQTEIVVDDKYHRIQPKITIFGNRFTKYMDRQESEYVAIRVRNSDLAEIYTTMTPQNARELAKALIEAAEQAERCQNM
jgi:predicted nucleic-acid-binding Zn-ribbon protein